MSPARRRTGPAAGSLARPVAPMLAAPVDEVPTGPDLIYEPKWDGWRLIAFRDDDGVHLQSRVGRNLTAYFPDITRALRSVPPGTVLDGELIVWEGERTSFALLQRRITAGRQLLVVTRRHPAHYVVFDLLAAPPGRPLLDAPLAERRAQLADLLAGAPPQITLSPQTADITQAAEWLSTWTAAGIEGVMSKKLNGRYEPGRRGWRKYRAYCTTEAVIGGITGTISNPDTLLIGRLNRRGWLRYTGRTHPLRPAQRQELARVLSPLHAQRPGGSVAHPWPHPLPAAWSGQLDRPEPLRYTQVAPVVVAEIDVDTAFEHHRWRHRVRYLRPRLDLSVYDVPLVLDDNG